MVERDFNDPDLVCFRALSSELLALGVIIHWWKLYSPIIKGNNVPQVNSTFTYIK